MQSDDLPIVGQTFTYIDDAADDDLITSRPREFSGTFDGAEGTYECATGDCSIVRSAEGDLTLVGATWTFTPDDDVTVDVPDPDYLHFGYWMRTTAGDDGNAYDFDTFSNGKLAFGVGDVNTAVEALEGTASYAGPASGLYVRKALDSSGGVTSARHGNFTADTNLTASFGGNDVALSNQFSIEGTIKNFMDGTTALSGWSVELEQASFAGEGAGTRANTFDDGATTGGGAWSGAFFGAVTENDGDTPDVDESETGYPSGVAGEFDAHFSNGHVNGAFGAELQD